MKIPTMILAGVLAPCAGHAATTINAFWSVQTDQAGDTPDPVVTAENFPGTPSITRAAGAATNIGGAAYFQAYDGSEWEGSGSNAEGGRSFGWNAGAGNSITISLDMTSVYDLSLRADMRSAQSGAGVRPVAFTAIEYSLDGGAFTTTGLPLAFGIPADNGFNEYVLDLSGLAEIEDEGDVRIRFTIPTLATNTSFRLDNVQLTATLVPEPSALVMALGAGLLACRRRR